MATIDPSQTYTHLPISLDPTSKIVSAPSQSSDASLRSQIDALNALHQSMKSLETPNQVPPPPVPVNPKLSSQISKMREQASTAHRKGNYGEAIRLYGFAIHMANQRPIWEPVGLARDELALLYANRAQSQMAGQNWVEGWKDAECSVECKRVGNHKAWWRAGKCLCEMGRWTEAVEWLTKGLDAEGKEGEGKELAALLAEAQSKTG